MRTDQSKPNIHHPKKKRAALQLDLGGLLPLMQIQRGQEAVSFKPLISADLCQCDSGEPWWHLYDASAIYVARVCDVCVESVKARYRPEIFSDPGYETDEQKEPEEF